MIDAMSFAFPAQDMTGFDSTAADGSLTAMNEDEFRQFYERTARPLWAYLSRLTGDSQKADDLLQETYYRFCRAAARHSDEAHRRNSLFQIATNLVRDASRRAKHRTELSLDERTSQGHDPAATAQTPEDQVALQTDLQRAMSRLDPLQRELLWLAYAQGSSHEEIATILGLRAISIRTLLLRARKKLASILVEGVAR